MNLVPDNLSPLHTLLPSASALAAGLVAVPLIAFLRDPRLVLRAEHVITLAPIYWLLLDLFQGTYSLSEIPPEIAAAALLAIGTFVTAVWLGCFGRGWRLPRWVAAMNSHGLSAHAYFSLCVGAFVLAMLTFAIPSQFNLVKMFSYLGQQRWGAPWARGQFGGWDAFADQLQYFAYILPALTVIVGQRLGWKSRRCQLCIVMTLLTTAFLAQSGSRRVIGVIFGAALIVWILTEHRLRPKHMILAALSAVTILIGLQFMLEYRNRGFAVVAARTDFEPILRSEHINVDDNFYRLCQVMQLIPRYHSHTYHDYLIWVLVRPIPRVFWPGKPVDPGFDLPAAVGKSGVSLSMSVIGELYMAAGFLGIALGGWFFGRLAGLANQLLNRYATYGSVLIYAISVMALFTGVRSMLDLVLTSYAFLAWIALAQVWISLQRSKARRAEIYA